MAPETPEIVRGALSWFRYRSHGKIVHLGDTVVRGSPGFVPSDFSDKGTFSQVLPGMSSVSRVNKGTVSRVIPGVGGSPSSNVRATGPVLRGTADVFPTKKKTTDRMVSGISREPRADTRTRSQELQSISSLSRAKGEEDIVKKVPDIKVESPIKEQVSNQPLTDINNIYTAQEEGSAVQMVMDIRGESHTGEVDHRKIASEISDNACTEKGAPDLVGSEVTSKIIKIPSDREIHKEGYMDRMYYVARNEMESSLVRRMHPDCNVIIPSDYDKAIGEIITCPLNCPYRALEFAEIDQKMLRSRPAKPPK